MSLQVACSPDVHGSLLKWLLPRSILDSMHARTGAYEAFISYNINAMHNKAETLLSIRSLCNSAWYQGWPLNCTRRLPKTSHRSYQHVTVVLPLEPGRTTNNSSNHHITHVDTFTKVGKVVKMSGGPQKLTMMLWT